MGILSVVLRRQLSCIRHTPYTAPNAVGGGTRVFRQLKRRSRSKQAAHLYFWPQVALKSRAPTESACVLACTSSQTSNDFDFGSAWRGTAIWSREAALKPITSRYGFLSMFIALIQSCVYRVRIDLPGRCVSWGDCTTKVQLYDSYTIREDNGPFFVTNLTVSVLLFHSFLGTFCGRRAPCANRGGDSDCASLY